MRYVTDIEIPNLDAMGRRELERYGQRAFAEAEGAVSPRSDWLRMVADYARKKCKAMDLRQEGKIDLALRYERACENIYADIPQRMRW